jgi:AraC family transcriptional regulator, transcriptional activator of pobA
MSHPHGLHDGTTQCGACGRLPVFSIRNLEYGSVVKSVDFHMAPLQRMMSQLPYPHRHDFYHIVWVETGSGRHIIDSVEYKVQPNTLFFMSPGQVHDFAPSWDTTGFTINFSPEFFALQLEGKNLLDEIPFFGLDNKNHALCLDDNQAAAIRPLLQEIGEEYSQEQDRNNAVIRSYLYILLVKASRLTQPIAAADASRNAVQLARRFTKLLDTRFTSTQDVAEYSRMLWVTERALNEATRSALGSTAGQLIRARLILEAKRALAHSSANIASVADSLSFEDPAYFSRWFKKHTGSSPVEFRRSLLKAA